eukprot:PRCOL_00005712-RA
MKTLLEAAERRADDAEEREAAAARSAISAAEAAQDATAAAEELTTVAMEIQESATDDESAKKAAKKKKDSGYTEEPSAPFAWEDGQCYDARMGFWSQALLRVDALSAAGLVTPSAADALRLLVWRRNRRLRELYERAEGEAPGNDAHLAGLLAEMTKRDGRPGMHVVHVTAEMAPVAKVGGLGDVVQGLGRSLQSRGNCVEIVLPKYDTLDHSQIDGMRLIEGLELRVPFENHYVPVHVWTGSVHGLPVVLLDPSNGIFARGGPYGQHDDVVRFSIFSAAALEFLAVTGRKPDVIHIHEWTAAAAAPLFRERYARWGSLGSAALVFTAHSFEHQGKDGANLLTRLGLSQEALHTPARMADVRDQGAINLMKGAVAACDAMTTVSPTYAAEGCTKEFGFGLDEILSKHRNKLTGVLNGIDYAAWNPATDMFLHTQYARAQEADGDKVVDAFVGKAVNKRALQEEVGLNVDPHVPLVACVGRLAAQKGVNLIRHAVYRAAEQGAQFVLLGLPVDNHIRGDFENIAREFEGRGNVAIVLAYDEGFAHRVYAGSDILVMPSMYEPCGLAQMIAMRYGTVPVVRSTGGLRDSVDDVDSDEGGNGFRFDHANEEGLNYGLDRAIQYKRDNADWWRDTLVDTCMSTDWSWNTSAEHYEGVYQRGMAAASSRKGW